jgi:CubicO group peptidase (beta-lactamase class C family)
MNGRLLLTGVTALLSLVGLGASCRADEFDNVRDRIRQYIDKEGVPSISIAVVKGDEIAWEEGFGWADVEHQIRATPHTAYRTARSMNISATTRLVLIWGTLPA